MNCIHGDLNHGNSVCCIVLDKLYERLNEYVFDKKLYRNLYNFLDNPQDHEFPKEAFNDMLVDFVEDHSQLYVNKEHMKYVISELFEVIMDYDLYYPYDDECVVELNISYMDFCIKYANIQNYLLENK